MAGNPYKTDCTGCKHCQRREYGPLAAPETHFYRCAFFDDFDVPLMFRAFFSEERQLTKSARQIEGPWDDGGSQWTKCGQRVPA